MINFKDTSRLMMSPDYKVRFLAEYWQTKIRYEKLKSYCDEIEAASLTDAAEPPHDCPLELLREQQSYMGQYLHILEMRAKIENINLNSSIDDEGCVIDDDDDCKSCEDKYTCENSPYYNKKKADDLAECALGSLFDKLPTLKKLLNGKDVKITVMTEGEFKDYIKEKINSSNANKSVKKEKK